MKEQNHKNDFDRIADKMRAALAAFTGNMHEPRGASDSITITRDGALTGIICLQRAIDWCQGHADARRTASHRRGPGRPAAEADKEGDDSD